MHVLLLPTLLKPQDCSLQGSSAWDFPGRNTGLPFPSPGDLPNPGIKPISPALAGGFFTSEPPGHSLEKWKQPKYRVMNSLTNEWINKMWYIHTMEYYSTTKTNEVLIRITMWMNLHSAKWKKPVKKSCCMTLFGWNIWKNINQSTEIKSKPVDTRGGSA